MAALPHRLLFELLFRGASPITKLYRLRVGCLPSVGPHDTCLPIAVRAVRKPAIRHDCEGKRVAMKKQFASFIILTSLGFAFAQGFQGNAKLSGKATVTTTGHSVSLTWDASAGATSYNIYRGAAHNGPYTKISSGVVSTTYTDEKITHNQTLYYVITAVSGNNESAYSNEAAAVIP